MLEKGQWTLYIEVFQSVAAFHTTRRPTFATVHPDSHTANRHVDPPWARRGRGGGGVISRLSALSPVYGEQT